MQITVQLSGTMDIDEKRAAIFALKNANIAVPDTNPLIKAAYESLLQAQLIECLHTSNIKQSLLHAEKTLDLGQLKAALVEAAPAKRTAVIAAALAALA